MIKKSSGVIFSFLFFTLLSFHPVHSYAQTPKAFSSDSLKFLEEIDDYFSNVKGKEQKN